MTLSAWLDAASFTLWPSRRADRLRIAELEAELRRARCAKLNALLALFCGDEEKARLADEIAARDAVIAKLRAELEPFQRRVRHPRDGKFVKVGRII